MKVGTLALALVAAAFLVAGTGCADNKIEAERDSLQIQNKQLNDQLTAEREARQLAESQLKTQQTAAPVEQAPDMAGGPLVMDGGLRRVSPTGKAGAISPAPKGTTPVKAAVASRVTLPGHVLFGSGKTTLDATATKTLDTMAATIKSKYAGDKLVIEGYTDSTPPSKTSVWKSNDDLAKARATAVKNYLVKKGVKGEITVKAVGAADGKDAAASRRVEVVVETK